ncbi:MAG: response regulator [Candidatus Omnitrophica bacterium]|nr:response regulator [Candidatus Omnitrophota bacterium]
MKRSSRYPLRRTRKEKRDLSWKLTYENFMPAKEGLREVLCTLGNGYLGTRGASPESRASRIHYPGTYIAGVYNKLSTDIAGKTVSNEAFINCTNWLPLTFRIENDDWIVPSSCKILFYYQELDMRSGVLSRKVRFRERKGYTFTVETARIVHIVKPHLAAIKYVITPEDYEGPITIRSGLDGSVENKGVARYRQLNSRHLKAHAARKIDKNTIHLSVVTSQSKIVISQSARTRIFRSGEELHAKSTMQLKHEKAIYQDFTLRVCKNNSYEVEKIVSIYTSKDKGVKDPGVESVRALKRPLRFDGLIESHRKRWGLLWKTFDINISGDATFRKILRLHTFHLIQSASFHNINIDAGLPARGLHGEAYRGHIFWDQLFVMPFYLLRAPQIARALIMYRYRRLKQARKNAREAGYKGAMFPWQSGADGDEQTQSIHLNPMSGKWDPDYSFRQRHVSFAVAHNVWEYWYSTRDTDFLFKYGAEILLSISQFASSLTRYSHRDGRYHTEGLMGPDEFHEKLQSSSGAGFRDNAYTNVFIVATLLNTFKVLRILPVRIKRRLLERLGIDDEELMRWEDITRKMNIIFNNEGIIAQFEDYFRLREIDLDAYREKYGNVHRMDRILKAEGKSPNDYKVAKQADVLMMFYIFEMSEIRHILNRLGYYFDRGLFSKNYDYYIKKTSHGSTLSKVVHCYLSHLLHRDSETWQWYLDVLKSDIYDTQGGTTPEGIHTGVMGGSINIAIKSFCGINFPDDRIRISPSLPKNWRRIKLRFLYKGRWVFVNITRRLISIFIRGPKSRQATVAVEIYGKKYKLSMGRLHKLPIDREITMAAADGVKKVVQEKVLIADGDILQAVMLRTRMEALGYLADCVYSGHEALDILKTGWVDLIILAVSLQGNMNGYQLLKDIKKRKRFSNIPIIMQTKKAGMKKVFERRGIDAYFVKPYPVELLLDKAQKIIGTRG